MLGLEECQWFRKKTGVPAFPEVDCNTNGLLYEVSEDITEGMDSDSSLEDDEGEDLDDEDSNWDEMYEMYGSDWDGDQSD